MTWWIAILLKPVFALVFMVCLVLPLKLAFVRWFPEGEWKRALLSPVHEPTQPPSQ